MKLTSLLICILVSMHSEAQKFHRSIQLPQSNILLFEKVNDTLLVVQENDHIVTYRLFDTALNLIDSKSFDITVSPSVYAQQLWPLQNSLGHIHQGIYKNNRFQIRVGQTSLLNSNLKNPAIVYDETVQNKEGNSLGFSATKSPSGKFSLLFRIDSLLSNDSVVFKAIVLDHELSPIVNSETHLAFRKDVDHFLGATIDDDGDAIILFGESFESYPLGTKWDVTVLHSTSNTFQSKQIKLPDAKLKDIIFTATADGNVSFFATAGTSENRPNISGLTSLELNKNSLNYSVKYFSFDNLLVNRLSKLLGAERNDVLNNTILLSAKRFSNSTLIAALVQPPAKGRYTTPDNSADYYYFQTFSNASSTTITQASTSYAGSPNEKNIGLLPVNPQIGLFPKEKSISEPRFIPQKNDKQAVLLVEKTKASDSAFVVYSDALRYGLQSPYIIKMSEPGKSVIIHSYKQKRETSLGITTVKNFAVETTQAIDNTAGYEILNGYPSISFGNNTYFLYRDANKNSFGIMMAQ